MVVYGILFGGMHPEDYLYRSFLVSICLTQWFPMFGYVVSTHTHTHTHTQLLLLLLLLLSLFSPHPLSLFYEEQHYNAENKFHLKNNNNIEIKL